MLPFNTGNSQGQTYAQLNDTLRRLEKENVTKTFKQPGGNAIVQGKLPYDGGYGAIFYDSDSVPFMIQGILPDGTAGLVIAKDGVNILTDVFS